MPLSFRLKFVGNLSNTPAFPLTSQKSCDFFMFEPNSYYVQIYCCSIRLIFSQIGCGYMYSAPVLNNSSCSSKFSICTTAVYTVVRLYLLNLVYVHAYTCCSILNLVLCSWLHQNQCMMCAQRTRAGCVNFRKFPHASRPRGARAGF